ncbi:MAG: hypothetical protein ACR2MY_15425 [Candidatus Dormibacteria bacterium]
MDRDRQQEIRQRLLALEGEGADLGRVLRRIGWTPEEGLRHLEEFLDDMRLLRVDFARSGLKPQVQ